ncbi:MAG: helix-hairpin-helix domain-containing protein [Flavobacteriales bacterium]|nr:helix-hairpin-helix domain-containing protein [Flavobacteriales bacterium]MBK7942070.1 helix-hairpin-helix domain-containing protein [Flavobacteriales bacterium]MBK9700611.1 helix-hairpin-helix domain-containing protein [Flavobacteriales bacterium]
MRRARWMDAFSMHRAERRGLFVLVLTIAAFGAWIAWMRQRPPDPALLAAAEAQLATWLAEQQAADSLRARSADAAPAADSLFAFDPNTATENDWRRLGLSERQARGVLSYIAHGGQFEHRQDLARLRSLHPDQVARLLPFVQLPDRPEGGGAARAERRWPRDSTRIWTRTERPARPERVALELNGCDSAALVALPGVGPSFARGILRYRDQLGGYHSLDQLAEVYVLKDKPEALAQLRTLLRVDTALVRRVPMNSGTVEELAAHPYLRWKLAKTLVAYRRQHGPFRTVDDLRGCALVDEGTLRTFAPYFSVK